MLRGRIDVLIPLADGNVILDYKTDRVRVEEIEALAERYRPQADSYRQAVQAITGAPVKQVLMVFLHARVAHSL